MLRVSKKKKRGILIGRFQPFHRGHLDALKQIARRVDQVTILIGSSNISRTSANPLSFSERKNYLRECGVPYSILPLPDHPSDAAWCEKVKKRQSPETIFFSGNTYVQKLLKQCGIPCEKVQMNLSVSATEIRAAMRNDRSYKGAIIHPLPKNLIRIIKETK